MTTPRLGESITTAGGRIATRVPSERYGPSILATNLERERKAKREKSAPEVISQSRLQQREQAQATAWAKGRKLSDDGYKIRPTSIAYCWNVARPGERRTAAPEGGTVERYTVKFEAGEWVCDCPFCSLHGICKHVVGVRLYLSACAFVLSPAFDFAAEIERLGLQDITPEVNQ